MRHLSAARGAELHLRQPGLQCFSPLCEKLGSPQKARGPSLSSLRLELSYPAAGPECPGLGMSPSPQRQSTFSTQKQVNASSSWVPMPQHLEANRVYLGILQNLNRIQTAESLNCRREENNIFLTGQERCSTLTKSNSWKLRCCLPGTPLSSSGRHGPGHPHLSRGCHGGDRQCH